MAKPLKSRIANLKESFKNLKQEVAAKIAATGDTQAHKINFKGRANIQVSKNVGQPGGTALSSSKQDSPIDQENSI